MKLKNRFFLIRHGQALSNTKNITSSWPEKRRFPLTEEGKSQIKKLAKSLKKKGADHIFSSDLLRTKQTAEILGKELKLKPEHDKRLREYDFGVYNGKSILDFYNNFNSQIKRFSSKPKNGENYKEISKRMFSFLKDTDRRFKNKTILVVSHQVPIIMLIGKMEKLSNKQIVKKYLEKDRIKNGEIRQL